MMGVVSTQGIRRAPVLITDSSTALALSMMINTFGQSIFPDMTMTGGTFVGGVPVIVSDSVPHSTSGGTAILVNAPEILVADEGGFDIAMSRDASLQMTDTRSEYGYGFGYAESCIRYGTRLDVPDELGSVPCGTCDRMVAGSDDGGRLCNRR